MWLWLWRENKIHADPSMTTHCNEQPDHIPQKISCREVIINTIIYLAISATVFGALFGPVIYYKLTSNGPDRQIRFSIISMPVSGLNPNASSSPVFNIIFQAEEAFENGTEMCLGMISTTISYHGMKIAKVDEDKSGCYYIEDYSINYVISVPMLASVPRYLQKQFWAEREITMFDLEMDFLDNPWNYHVWCSNVTLGAMDTPIPCNVTM